MENYIQNQFVTYEIALKLKELGFNEPCFKLWYAWICEELLDNGSEFCINSKLDEDLKKDGLSLHTWVAAPLWQQVIDFFREKFDIIILILPFGKLSESHFNNWINLRKIHYSYEIYKINKRVIDVETINKAKVMIGDISTNEIISTDDTLLCIATGNSDNYYEAKEQAILKAIELCTEKQ